MKFGLLIAFIICTVDSTSKCGPDGLCHCGKVNVMNCSANKRLPLRKICDFINDVDVANISILYLEGNGYKTLRTEDLNGCKSLNTLFLRRNEVSDVEESSLMNLHKLRTLDLSFNKLDVYNKKGKLAFALPKTLKDLFLSGNLNVTKYDDVMYPDLSHLSYIEQLTLDGLKNKTFPASYNRIQTLSLSGLNGHCNIFYVTNATFKYLSNVRVLNLSFCNIINIEAEAFKSLLNLEVLDVSGNMNLGFCNLRNVSYSLQFTQIKSLNYSKVYPTFGIGTQLALQDFCYLWNTNLTEIVLNNNRIELVDINVLILMPNTLKILRAENNKFTFGPYLYQLGCFSHLEEFYGNFQNLANDPKLYMKEPTEDGCGSISTNFTCPYTELHVLLNISKTKKNCPFFKNRTINMHSIKPTFPTSMKRLEFSYCGMQYNLSNVLLSPAPYELNMEYLDGSGNILYSWDGPVGPFPHVKYLNLSRNYCSHIGLNFFESFQTVEDLQIQENFLGLVLRNEFYGPVIFRKLTNVKVLNLSSNIISYLHPTVFSNMAKLTTLDLSVNNIESLTFDVGTLNSLMHINLKFNFIHSLPLHFREKLDMNSKRFNKPFTVDLSNNTISIDCDEKEFLKWLFERKKNIISFEHYIFLDKSGQRVSLKVFEKDVRKLDKDCYSYSAIIVACSVGISVFLAVVIGGVVYKNRWKLQYLMRLTKIRYFGYTRIQQYFNEPDRFVYDTFISYANENVRFVLDKLIPKLEEQDLKLCLHDRDFLPGNNIADNILQAISNSRKTVAIISKDFLKSQWCLFEFNMARMESIYCRAGDGCLVVILLEDVPTRNMSNEMLDWMRANTYVEYTTDAEGELLFWENFLHVLQE